jgi:hypothetical protein
MPTFFGSLAFAMRDPFCKVRRRLRRAQ